MKKIIFIILILVLIGFYNNANANCIAEPSSGTREAACNNNNHEIYNDDVFCTDPASKWYTPGKPVHCIELCKETLPYTCLASWTVSHKETWISSSGDKTYKWDCTSWNAYTNGCKWDCGNWSNSSNATWCGWGSSWWVCWDWNIDSWEQCDWGSNCNSDCTKKSWWWVLCWNWVVESWEECDWGSDCNSNCTKKNSPPVVTCTSTPAPTPSCSGCWGYTAVTYWTCSCSDWSSCSRPSKSSYCPYIIPTCSISYSWDFWKWIKNNKYLNPSTNCWTYNITSTPSWRVSWDYSGLVYFNLETSYSITCTNWDKTSSDSWWDIERDNKIPAWTINFKNQDSWIKVINWKNWVNSDREIEYDDENDFYLWKIGSWIKSASIWWWPLSYFWNRTDFLSDNTNNWKDFQYSLFLEDFVLNKSPWIAKTKIVYFDNQAPSLVSSSFIPDTWTISLGNWTNSSKVSLEFKITDVTSFNWNNGSWIKDFELREIKTEYWATTSTETKIEKEILIYFCSWDEQNKTCTFNKTFNSNNDNWATFNYELRNVTDNVWNPAVTHSLWTVKFDNIPPEAGDISSIPDDWEFLYATETQNFEVRASNNSWAPITELEADFEKYNDKSDYFSRTSSSWILEKEENIKLVDNDLEASPNNYRVYSQKITKACDEAGNCSCNPIWSCTAQIDKTINYNVLAWITDLNSVDKWDLDNWNAIANWTGYLLEINLEDEFWNVVSPVYKDWTDVRKVKIKLEYDNNLHLNQYNIAGSDSSVEAKINNKPVEILTLWNTENTTFEWEYDNLDNRNWRYPINFNVYTPTYKSWATDWREFTLEAEKFEITDINAILEDDINWTNNTTSGSVLASSVDFAFKPIYDVTFSGSIKNNWLVEWAAQASQIKIDQNWTWYSTWSEEKVFLEFIDNNNKFDLHFQENIWTDIYYKSAEKEVSTWINSLAWKFNTTDSRVNLITLWKNILTLLTQKQWVNVKTSQETSFSTYTRYILNWKTVIYPWEKIWKTENQKTKQSGLNVVWYISNDIATIIENTKWKDLNNIWKLTKLDFKKVIERNIYKALKNQKFDNWNNTINNLEDFSNNTDWTKLQNNNILYFKWWKGITINWNNSKLVTLWNWNDLWVKWKKTIVVVWANLYIKSNMYYINQNEDILWVVVLKDEAWVGWNIYIDPNVTNMVWTYYMSETLKSWSLNSSNEMKEYTDVNDINDLKNQLHIFWNIFSENTIGWARANPYKCPYFVNQSVCKKEEAQKYDLNFLRRYVLVFKENNSWKDLYLPMNDWKVIWNGECKLVDNNPIYWIYDWTECIPTNSKFARSVKTTDDPYAAQSVVIEYNNNFLKNIPPMFKK